MPRQPKLEVVVKAEDKLETAVVRLGLDTIAEKVDKKLQQIVLGEGTGESDDDIKKRLEEAEKECQRNCALIRKELDSLRAKNKYTYELDDKASLKDLLEKVVLAPIKEWKEQIINLVNIRPGEKGDNLLRGPDYFEALFQLAFYLGLFPGISDYERTFRDKKGKKVENFLGDTPIKSSGGGQTGISDITFELIDKDKSKVKDEDFDNYKCGVVPKERDISGNQLYFISVKRYTKEKSPRYYDVAELFTYVNKTYPEIGEKNYKVCVCCRNYNEFKSRMYSSRSEYIVNSINRIYGFDYDSTNSEHSLLNRLEIYRNACFSNIGEDIPSLDEVNAWVNTTYPAESKAKLPLSLYFHQELIVNSVTDRIVEQRKKLLDKKQKKSIDKSNSICIGVLPRGGKSYIAGGIINKMMKDHDKATRFWVLFITSAVNETMSQFQDDLINKFADFDTFDFINLTDSKKGEYKSRIDKGDAKANSFIFVSRELLTQQKDDMTIVGKDASKKEEKRYAEIFTRLGFKDEDKIPFKLVFFDEAHKGGITKTTKGAMYKHIEGTPPFILMTATYKKLLDKDNGYIDLEQDLFIWDLDDIRLMRKLPKMGLENFENGEEGNDGKISKYNLFNRYTSDKILSLIKRRLSLGETLESIVKPYENFVEPYFISATFTDGAKQKLIAGQIDGGNEGFEIQEHFDVQQNCAEVKALLDNPDEVGNWHKALKNKQKAIALRSFLTPNDDGGKNSNGEDELVSKFDEKDKILNRIFAVARKEMGLSARPQYGTPFSILMFLPTGAQGSNIGATCRAWGSLLLDANYWRDNFVILGLSEYKVKECPKPKKVKEKKETVDKEPEESEHEGGAEYELFHIGGAKEIPGPKCLSDKKEGVFISGYCSQEKLDAKDLKKKIQQLERAALKERKGLVILTGDRAKMGISLPCVDVVCLFDNNKEPDEIIQKMYRALTDSPGKKRGFIVDLNPRRIFKAKFEYALIRNKSQKKDFSKDSVADIIDNIFKANLWDCDAWKINDIKRGDFNTFMQKIKEEILGSLDKELFKVYEEDVQKEDVKLLMLGKALDSKILELLQVGKKGKKKSIVYQNDSKAIVAPGNGNDEDTASEDEDSSEEGAEALNDSEEESAEKEVKEDDESAKYNAHKKLSELTRQFINILIIRNSDSFRKNPKLGELLDTYNGDRLKIKDKILTEKIDECKENNLFFRVFNDIQNFVDVPKSDVNGFPYVGAADLNDERYNKIPNGAIIFYRKTKKDTYNKAVYNSLSKLSINKWASKIKGFGINIFTDVDINDSEEIKIISSKNESIGKVSLGEYVEKYKNQYAKDNSPKTKPTLLLLGAIEERLKEKEVKILYSNYIESFINNMEKVSSDIKYLNQSGGEQASSSKRYNKVLQVIDDYLVPSDTARKERGEIFTPPDLVRQMLYGIKSDSLSKGVTEIWGFDDEKFNVINEENRVGGLPEKEVWSNPNLKWLDPANGIGNFPIIAYYKLDYSLSKLKEWEDNDKRRKHIIENMLYMMELDNGNNETCKGLFKKIYPDAKPNILCCDSLEISYEEIKKEFGIDKFHIIMGNPPFNPPKTETGSSGNSIWQNFVIKSLYMLEDNGYLVLVHPSGWKKPTEDIFKPVDFTDGAHYKYDAKSEKRTMKQIRQGQVWQLLKDLGNFSFIYTNDQKVKSFNEEFIDFFPAVDYYVYQKTKDKSTCDTKNVFLGQINKSTNVRLNYKLKYLPNLITKETQDILYKITSKDGDKPIFGRFRNGKDFSLDSSKGKYKYIYTYSKKGEPKYQYSDVIGDDNINLDKVIMNFDGGIDCYTIQYVKKEEMLGSYEMTMYSKVQSDKDGKRLEALFKSDIVKFIFLITQYASGKMTKNEPLVANSITIPPEGTTDYYKFFEIEEHKKYIEEILAHYDKFSAPKNTTRKANKPESKHKTLKNGPCSGKKERNPVTGHCVKPCPKTKIRAAKTDKCIKKPKTGGVRLTRKIRR